MGVTYTLKRNFSKRINQYPCFTSKENLNLATKRNSCTVQKIGSSSHCRAFNLNFSECTLSLNVNLSQGVYITRHGKINFVDLAGSEMTKKTKSEGKTLEEANNINKSLMVLGKKRFYLISLPNKCICFVF